MTAQQTTAQRIALRKRAIFAAAGKAGLDLRDAAERGRMVRELTGAGGAGGGGGAARACLNAAWPSSTPSSTTSTAAARAMPGAGG